MPANLVRKAVLDALYFSGASLVASSWMGGLGAIFMLHRVNEIPPDGGFSPNAHLSVSPQFLEKLLARLRRRGVAFLSLDEAAKRLNGDDLGRENTPFVVFTLDDGYRDNLVHAVPLFRKYEAPYAIYCAPGLVEGGAHLWWEDLAAAIACREHFAMHSPKGHVSFDVSTPARKRQVFAELLDFLTRSVSEAEQRRLVGELARQCGVDTEAHRVASIMNWRELVELSRDPLCTIGAHTVRHYALARLDAAAAHDEMVESARIIAMVTGATPRHFAYPYGYPAAAGRREFALAKGAGFQTAVTTRHGVLCREHAGHLLALPRISLNGHFQSLRHVDTLLSGLPARLQNRGRRINVA